MTGSEFGASQFEAAYADGIGHFYWSRARNMILHDAVQIAPSNRWLEIGCGRGVVVEYLRGCGIDIEGVELADAKPLASVSDFIRCGVSSSDLTQSYRDEFDGILLLDVIEHIEDPIAFLRDAGKDIRNARTLIVAVPARPELWSNYDTHFGHFRRYTRTSLHDELERAGWKPQWVEYRFRALYPPAWLLLKMFHSRATATNVPSENMKAFHRIIAWMLWAESRLPLGPIPGTSVFAVANRA